MKRCFSQTNCDIMSAIQALNFRGTFVLICNYLWRRSNLSSNKKAAGTKTLTSLPEFTEFLEPFNGRLLWIFKFRGTAPALPLKTAACERSFSTLIKKKKKKLIKKKLLAYNKGQWKAEWPWDAACGVQAEPKPWIWTSPSACSVANTDCLDVFWIVGRNVGYWTPSLSAVSSLRVSSWEL